MSTYKEIHGKAVKTLSSDPTDDGAAGQVWYNTTSETFKTVVNLEAWRTASTAISVMHAGQGFGSQTDAVGAGGYGPAGGFDVRNTTDEYNGSGWASGGNIGTARYSGSGCGSQTAGLIAGGTSSPGAANLDVEEYNGASWAEQTNLSTGHGYGWMAGIQTAAICYTGLSDPSPAAITVNAEEYNGSSWTEVGNVNTGKYGILGFGATKDTAVKVGGTSANTGVEEWNGSSWTAVNSIPANRADGMGSGSQTAGLLAAGNPGGMTSTLTYDGTNWTTSPATLSETRAANARGATITGNATGIIHHAGPGTPKYLLTEEYDSSTTAITAGAWSAGGNLPTPISATQGGGTQTAGLQMSGQPNAPGTAATTACNEYDGSAWAAGGALSAGARSYGGQASKNGSQTAMLYWKGHYSGNKNTVSSYDGSSWTAQSVFPNTNVYGGGCGTSTAALSVGGTPTASTEEGDGSYNWTTGGTLGSGGYNMVAAGPQTAAVTAGGSPPRTQKTEEYDGSSWTTKSDIIVLGPNTKDMGFGTNSDDLMVAGGPPNKTDAVKWDGTAWSTQPSIATGRQGGAGFGASSTSGVVAGGQSPFKTSTEEFTGETSGLNVKTLTQS